MNNSSNDQKSNGGLMEEEWFHGVLPREEVVRLLVVEGDFLVRETMRNEESQIVLSVCWDGHKHFIVQTTPEVILNLGFYLKKMINFINNYLLKVCMYVYFRDILDLKDQLFQLFQN